MARVRSVDFLPEIYQTPTNKKFLSSTLDQLVQEPKLKKTQGYIGRVTAPGKAKTDGYVVEPTIDRTHYQLEPGVAFKDDNGNVIDALSYMGLIDGLQTNNANVSNHDRLFESESYAWSPYIDFDKLINYNQYFWMPAGPSSVNVEATAIPLTNDYYVTANSTSYSVTGFNIENPTITLVRGGTYNFHVDQVGFPFYIQTQPGVSGTLPWANNISSRDVYGVTNNGTDFGVVTFTVPTADAQDFYLTLTDIGGVDLAYSGRMDDLANKPTSSITSINGIHDYGGKTIIFVNTGSVGWTNNSTPVTSLADRYSIYRIDIIGGIINLTLLTPVNVNEKMTIQYGEVYANVIFYKNASGYFERVPLITAPMDTLYYQDANNPDRYGMINLVTLSQTAAIDVNSIIGRTQYTSPNGVVFTNGMKVRFRGTVTPSSYAADEYYVEGVGKSIILVDSTELIVPELYTLTASAPWDSTAWDSDGWDGNRNSPLVPDYITINRASLDRNPWSRSNRWVHVSVIEATAGYNNVPFTVNNTYRAKRPIIEFDAGMRLFNFGTYGKGAIDIIDYAQTDALSNVNGKPSYTVDGFQLSNGSRIIFAADTDQNVRNKVYTVQFIDPTSSGTLIIDLIDTGLVAEEGDTLITKGGVTQQGTPVSFTGGEWITSQPKIAVNEPPLFDIFDGNGYSISDVSVYQSTTFKGTKLFSYKVGTGTDDSVLGFPLTYLNINNLGDIVFENSFYTDTFLYVVGNQSYDNVPVSVGYARKYSSRTAYSTEIGWTKAVMSTRQAQIFNISSYDGLPVTLDVVPLSGLPVPSVVVHVNNTFLNQMYYSVSGQTITFISGASLGDEIEIKVYSDSISATGYYEIPANLQSNPFNENTDTITLGVIRNHYNLLTHRITGLVGPINGANNTRDLGDITVYGTLLVQQSAPLVFAGEFLRNREYNFFNALKFNSRSYEKVKNQFLEWIANNDVYDMTSGQIVDAALKSIGSGKTINSAFYWSDMLPTGNDYETTVYTVSAISTDVFATLHTYDFTQANSKALLVYLNGVLLLKDRDYTVAADGPRITMLVTTNIDDIITINEYNSTVGSNVPSTPTKLGMFPRFRPAIIQDDTYVSSTTVIRGHDGSMTAGIDDVTNNALLEFEMRIYNNIKVNEDYPLTLSDIVPGAFRTTDYLADEVLQTLSPSVLAWLGHNRIDFKTQDYRKTDAKTWNYSATSMKIGNAVVKGHWRGLYKEFYDTDEPNVRPWEMLGLSEKPDWWEQKYGPAPYTKGNLVLWDDMEAGYLADPTSPRVLTKFVRPGLTQILPVDDEGNLIMPLDSIVKEYTNYDFKKSWQIGDEGPAETAWYKSSAFPFAVMSLYALTKPAIFFALMADRDRYTYHAATGQYLYDKRYRIDIRNMEIADSNVVKHSYINWIVDYNRHYGFESVAALKDEMANLSVNLMHHMASYTDKSHMRIYTDKSSPDSTNSSLLLPDESYTLLLYKNQPYDQITYSSVIVQKVDGGYAVSGNSTLDPYFSIQSPTATGRYGNVTVGRTEKTATTIRVPLDFEDAIETIPYGYVYSNKQAVGSFLVSYGEYLKRQGLQFNATQDDQQIDWTKMVQEFLYWTDQGWAPGSVINLNPSATELEFERAFYVVNNLFDLDVNEQPLDQNRNPLKTSDYVIDRIDNNFKLVPLNNTVVSYLKFELVNFENLLVLDNTSIFNDLIYDPVTGTRQQRVKLSGFTTYDWNGQFDAQGFLYNEDNIQEWSTSRNYNKGDIVLYKNDYWSATDKVQPSQTFNFDLWTKTDYGKISKGLLPNLATKASQQLHYYDNKTANLESDVDLLAFGLTGFRSRDYMESLDLDDISQVNVYSDMIRTKGTLQGIDLFQGATLNNQVADYQILENWGIRRARYGATGSRAYVEFNLDGTKLDSNPSTLEFLNTRLETSTADETITLSNIYKQSINHTSKNILPLLTEKDGDTALLSAGFVNPDDVDVQTFDLAGLGSASTITAGQLIWVAKDTTVDWNVYTALQMAASVIRVLDNLNGTLTVEFGAAHNLVLGETVIIQNFDTQVNGAHVVESVVSTTEITIAGQLRSDQTVIENVTGTALELSSSRLAILSDIAGSRFDNQLFGIEKVWIDTVNGFAATYEKQDQFDLVRFDISPVDPVIYPIGGGFGASVAVGLNGSGMMAGAPTLNTNGVVYCYTKEGLDFVLDQTLRLNDSQLKLNYGDAVELRTNTAVVSAPGFNGTTITGIVSIVERNAAANYYKEHGLIVSPHQSSATDWSSNFGTALAMSDDEVWVCVGEPSKDEVHVFQRIDYEIQTSIFTLANATNQLNVSSVIKAATAGQIAVNINSTQLTAGVDYTFDGTTITFSLTYPAGTQVDVTRRDAVVYTPNVGNDGQTFDISALYAVSGTESVSVTVKTEILRPYIDFVVSGTNVVLTTPLVITDSNAVQIETPTYYRFIQTISGTVGSNFGASIDIASDGSQIVIGAPNATVNTLANAGATFVYDHVSERTIINNASQIAFTTTNALTSEAVVTLNGTRLSYNPFDAINNYTVSGNTVTLSSGQTAIGDFLDITTNTFTLVQELDAATPEASATFGNDLTLCKSKCSVFVGAEGANSGQGNVTRFVNGTRMYGSVTATIANPVIAVQGTIRVNNVTVTINPTSLASDIANDINTANSGSNIPNVIASATNGYLTIELYNKELLSPASKLDVASGTIPLSTFGMTTYYESQVVTSPVATAQAQNFGHKVFIDRNLNQLAVSAVNGNQQHVQTLILASGTTYTADTNRLEASNASNVVGSGVVYTYDLLQDATIFSEGKLVFGEQIQIPDANVGEAFGSAIGLDDGMLVVGASGYPTKGRVVIYKNVTGTLTWRAVTEENPVVDVTLINHVFLYDKVTQDVTQYLDYIDPLNGKILGVARENVDFLTVYDPAVYDGTYSGQLWGPEEVDSMWWDISTVRFMNYNLGDVKTSAKLWGKVFPGSTVDIYQWIESDVLPANYIGTGTASPTANYVTVTVADKVGNLHNKYYYWVKNVETISTNSQKTLSAAAVSQYIESPVSSGISYVGLLAQNQVAFFNCKSIITEEDTVLHLEYDKIKNDANVFVEYDLFRENNPTDFLSDPTYVKLQDSFCGVDILGNRVPDTGLHPQDRYGIDFRPRKSMFENRFAALKNYLQKVNTILESDTFAEGKTYSLLNAFEPMPAAGTGAWDAQVISYQELQYQNINILPVGYKFLVTSDETSDGYWAIYQVVNNVKVDTTLITADSTTLQASNVAVPTLRLIRVQDYDTTRYWTTTDWYASTYDTYTKIDYVVDHFTSLVTLPSVQGSVAKVLMNGEGKWEIYMFNAGAWERVALQSGTLQFSESLWDYSKGRYGFDVEVFDAQHFDQEPLAELRNIIRAINEQILIGDYALQRNQTILAIFNYILAEQPSVDWLTKTSFINVTQNVRSLAQYQIFQKDNQDYLLKFINEAKPYHTKIKDFSLSYNGLDLWAGNVSDFDCPSAYNVTYSKFISPILDANGVILTTDVSNTLASDAIWTGEPWKSWYDNYKLSLVGIVVTAGGSGYTSAPTVTVNGTYTTPASAYARLGPGGVVTGIVITDPGSGYIGTPTISFSGGGGSGAVATAVMSSDLVRSLKTTIKYDRYEYTTNVMVWAPNTVYVQNQLVRVNNVVYQLINADGVTPSPTQFDPQTAQLVSFNDLSGVDRTAGYYIADVNNPGLDLSLLINGIAFPGVEVQDVDFLGDTTAIDTIYESSFLDAYLGTRSTDINVDGGAFVDTYHSHAPEELVPGIVFDTLDIRVISRPGADYTGAGHAFVSGSKVYQVAGTTSTLSFANLVTHPIDIIVVNLTTGKSLYKTTDYTLDWPNMNVNITAGIAASDSVKVFAYEIGGGNQLYRNELVGSNTTNGTFTVDAGLTEIYECLVYVNGVLDTGRTLSAVDLQTTLVTLFVLPAPTDYITVTVFGYQTPQHEPNVPSTQTFVYGTNIVDGGTAILQGTNEYNAVVELNGLRLRPPEGVQYIGDGLTVQYAFPAYGGYPYAAVADNEISVFVNGVQLVLNVDYTVTPSTATTAYYGTGQYGISSYTNTAIVNPMRYVDLVSAPVTGDVIQIYVRHASDYWFNGSLVTFNVPVIAGDLIGITTWGDTSELGILTEVFVGPSQQAQSLVEGFDTVGFDSVPFSYDLGSLVNVNQWTLSSSHANADRLWVTLNGKRLAAGSEYIVSGTLLTLIGEVVQTTDVLVVTSVTDAVVSNGVNFRYFKDMRDNVAMYKLNNTNTTFLTQQLLSTDDIVYVNDASKLGVPDLAIARFGILIVGGERITYRSIDLVNNTVSGLFRSSAGTGIATSYPVGTKVEDVSSKSVVPGSTYVPNNVTSIKGADYIVGNSTLTLYNPDRITTLPNGSGAVEIIGFDGFHLAFTALDLVTGVMSGISVVQDNPSAVQPSSLPVGSMVRSMVRDSLMYANGTQGTPGSTLPGVNSIPLQDQTTLAAIFLKN